ncbi:MAG: hypothetical protein H6712_03125 [Myxococcales bacterium]|nr:hypothetical protein [Myxococcales bacterium]
MASILVLTLAPDPGAVAPPPTAAPAPTPAQPTAPATEPATPAASSAATTVVDQAQVEACDGSRTPATVDPRALACERWTIAWREGGTAWGFVSAVGYDEVIAERERELAFARRYSRYFGVPLDERYSDPSEPICDACTEAAPTGRYGEGQRFGGGGAAEAITAAREQHQGLKATLDEHLPHLEDAARLAQEPATARAAKAYAKQLRHAMLDLARAELTLDNAAVFRSAPMAEDLQRSLRERQEALLAAHGALGEAVAREVAAAYEGKYAEEGAAQPEAPFLEVSIDGIAVRATYSTGQAQATWFEGSVGLDGAIAGRSLVAPDSGVLSCQAHTEECGYVYVDSVLRFTARQDPDQKPRTVAELWMRRSNWVMAKPFVR